MTTIVFVKRLLGTRFFAHESGNITYQLMSNRIWLDYCVCLKWGRWWSNKTKAELDVQIQWFMLDETFQKLQRLSLWATSHATDPRSRTAWPRLTLLTRRPFGTLSRGALADNTVAILHNVNIPRFRCDDSPFGCLRLHVPVTLSFTYNISDVHLNIAVIRLHLTDLNLFDD